jgi:hypothetical protein
MSKQKKTQKNTVKEVQEVKQFVKVISQQEEQNLLDFINDMPTKFGLPLLKYLQKLKVLEL